MCENWEISLTFSDSSSAASRIPYTSQDSTEAEYLAQAQAELTGGSGKSTTSPVKAKRRQGRQMSHPDLILEDMIDDEHDVGDIDYYYSKYDDLGRTPPRTRMQQNRKWKDNKKMMTDITE